MITQLPLVMRKAFLTSLSRKSTRLIQLRVWFFYQVRVQFIKEKISTKIAEVIAALQEAIKAWHTFQESCKNGSPTLVHDNLSRCCSRLFSRGGEQSSEKDQSENDPTAIELISQ